jgi:DNA (cytosine-5)-methyltransferase 1
MAFTFGSLFAGIGGFDLGLERAGMQCSWQVEIDSYATKILEKHWPDVTRFRDIRDCGSHNLGRVDLIAGGFPCQPFSNAGKRMGKEDDRYLWPEMLRIIKELQPTWVIAENVPGFANLGLDDTLADLESEGYEARAFDIPALALGAWHRRQRLFIVAYTDGSRRSQRRGPIPAQQALFDSTQYVGENISDAESARSRELSMQPRKTCVDSGRLSKDISDSNKQSQNWNAISREIRRQWEFESGVGRVAHGISRRVDRLKCLGNAVVPQVAEVIGRMILAAEEVTE